MTIEPHDHEDDPPEDDRPIGPPGNTRRGADEEFEIPPEDELEFPPEGEFEVPPDEELETLPDEDLEMLPGEELELAREEAAVIPPGEVLIESDREFAAIADRAARPRHRVKDFFTMLGLALAAFVTGLFVFNSLVMPRLIHSVAEVRVPELTNLTLERAEKQLGALGLQLSRAGERFDPTVPRGFIISQDPAPDTPVRGQRRVMVIVSLGEEFSSVPALFGESLRGARLLLERAGLKVAGITHAPSDEVGEGLVVASDPPAETVLPHETPVGLLVSSGAGPEYYVMPDVVGREIAAVRQQLESLGFRVITPPGAPSIGTIVTQEPAAGSRITREVEIRLQATGRIIR
jgi:beta-lactam-binding protein with PASTA domain